MAFADLSFRDYPRAEMRLGLLASGVPAGEVDECVDIACHAADSARRALLATVDRASSAAIATCAIGLAASLAKADADRLLEGIQAYADHKGVQAHSFMVKG